MEKRVSLEENHKGTWCEIDPNNFCQEGYCSNCEIYQRSLKMTGLNLLNLAQKRDSKQKEIEMILYSGKAKGMTREAITKAWLKQTRDIEPLEAIDFCKN